MSKYTEKCIVKRNTAQKLVVISCILAIVTLSGCELLGINTTPGQTTPGSTPGTPGTPGSTTTPPTTDPNLPPSYYDFPEPEAPGISVKSNEQAIIDYSNSNLGYFMARSLVDTATLFRVLIIGPGEQQYNFVLQPNSDFQAFPFPFGNGNYSVGVYENIEGDRYSTVLTHSIDVVITDEFAPFLRSNQYVDFNRNTKAVSKAAELVAGIDDMLEKVEAIYDFVIANFTYDYELAEAVQSGYVPDLDAFMQRGKGICFDYASLMTAMLRSQGIPTKLVIGYVGDVYHAWISVYSDEHGWIRGIIRFDGHEWTRMDPTYTSNSDNPATISFIGDGANYHPIFFF